MKTPYTYTVIRYVHDRAAGETLNVGVLVYAPVAGFVGLKFESRFERLSHAFGGFDGDVYRQTLSRLTESVDQLRKRFSLLPEMRDLPKDAPTLIRTIWPDVSLSFEAGPLLTGIAREPLNDVVAELFGRMVTSQMPNKGEAEHRSDEDVWTTYNAKFRTAGIADLLAPRKLTTAEFTIEFEHAFQNRQIHAVQPVTMDFVRAEYLQEKATKWVGTATALAGHPKLGKLYIVLGEPKLESHRSAYDRAKNLLHKMPVDHELIEERDAKAFAEELAAFMRKHGVVGEE